MIRRTFTVSNRLGLHARAAAHLVSVTGRFRSRVTLSRPGRAEAIDAKSILGVLMLAAQPDTQLHVEVDGDDEEAAMAAVSGVFDRGFREPGREP